jgi:hypothetical protein
MLLDTLDRCQRAFCALSLHTTLQLEDPDFPRPSLPRAQLGISASTPCSTAMYFKQRAHSQNYSSSYISLLTNQHSTRTRGLSLSFETVQSAVLQQSMSQSQNADPESRMVDVGDVCNILRRPTHTISGQTLSSRNELKNVMKPVTQWSSLAGLARGPTIGPGQAFGAGLPAPGPCGAYLGRLSYRWADSAPP